MLKYFLDRNGQTTRRIAGKPGGGHIEVAASTEKIDPRQDIYQQMFKLGYVRVVELDQEIHVDAPKSLTKAQRYALGDRAKEQGKQVVINSREMLESRTSSAEAKKIVEALLC